MASTQVVFDILAKDRASSKFAAVGKAADKSTTTMGRLGKVAKSAAVGFTVAGAGAIAAGKYIFDYGARLEQMGMKAETVFGGQLGSVEKWADKSAAAMGLTSREATGLAANFADLLIPMGFTRKAAAGMATDVVGLSGALSQWSGGTKSAAEVSEILNAAMLGEMDGLKALGISISAAEVDAALLKKGQDKLTGAARQQAEALAVQNLIMAKSTDAQKAFAAGGSPLLSAQAKIKATLGEVRDELVLKMVPALTVGAEAIADNLVPAIETGIDAAKEIGKALAPAAEEIAEALKHLAGEGDSAGDMFNNTFIPALRTTAEVVGGVVDFIDDLPGPIKDIGVQAGIAALILPKLTGAVSMATTSIGGFVAGAKDAATRTARLGAAARTAAGIGGMVALTQATQESNKALSALETIGGAAAIGFAVGGPWGAAISTTAAVAHELGKTEVQIRKLGPSFSDQIHGITEFSGAIDGITGSATEATRALALQKLEAAGAIATGKELGLTTRQLVDAALGQKDASRAVGRALAQQAGSTLLLDGKYADLAHTLGGVTGDIRGARHTVQQATKATRDYGDALDHIPKRVRNHIEATGILPSVKGIAKVVAAARALAPNLKRRDITAIIAASGYDTTVKRVLAVERGLAKVDKSKTVPHLDADDRALLKRLGQANRDLTDLDRRKATPKADLSLEQYFRDRANLISSLNNIPDETVNVDIYEHYHPDPDRNRNPRLVPGSPRLVPGNPRGGFAAAPASGGNDRPIIVQFVLGDQVVEQALIRRSRTTGQPIQVKTL